MKQENTMPIDGPTGEGITPACSTCIHRPTQDALNCTAFPGGIPMFILLGMDDHEFPIDGDGGIIYKARETAWGKA